MQPWRLIEVPHARRADLGEAFVQALLQRDPAAHDDPIEAAREKALRAPLLLLAVVSHKDSAPPIPVAERLVALGCGIQNLLLMAEALGMGSGITSGQALNAPSLRGLFALSDVEEAVCFISVGTVASRKPRRERPAYTTFISSL